MVNSTSLAIKELEMIIERYDTGEYEVVSSGTAFLFEHYNSVYICTNKHNITGKNPFNNKCLNKDGITPSIIRMQLTKKIGEHVELGVDYVDIKVEAFKFHELDYVDIAVCKFNIASAESIIKLQTPVLNPFEKLRVMDEVFVPGYPDLSNRRTPIYRRGIISSEPTIPQIVNTLEVNDILFLDIITNSGQSGSPVLIESDLLRDELIIAQYTNRMKPYSIVGIYSGRHNFNVKDMGQLGIVWSSDYILDIVKRHYYCS